MQQQQQQLQQVQNGVGPSSENKASVVSQSQVQNATQGGGVTAASSQPLVTQLLKLSQAPIYNPTTLTSPTNIATPTALSSYPFPIPGMTPVAPSATTPRGLAGSMSNARSG